MKKIEAVIALGAILATDAPAFAGGDYVDPRPQAAQAQTIVEGRSVVSDSADHQTRAVTGEEVDHHKAPIYNFIHQQ
jgi:hypothetical protein